MFHYRCPSCKRHFCSQIFKKWTCPSCKSNDKLKLATRRQKDKIYKDEIDLTSQLANRIGKNKAKMARKAQAKSYARFFEVDSEDEEIVDNGEPEVDLDDLWEPEVHTYDINMRLTSGLFRAQCRQFDPSMYDQALIKRKSQLVAGTAGRQSCCVVMGAEILGKGTISAAGYAKMVNKWPDPPSIFEPKDAKSRPEWCHLIADSLGGPTEHENLVSASYGANTYMAVIEAMIKGHTGLLITVEAYCSATHFAEFIVYTIQPRNSSAYIRYTIDGRNYRFTKDDMTDVQNELDRWMKQHKV